MPLGLLFTFRIDLTNMAVMYLITENVLIFDGWKYGEYIDKTVNIGIIFTSIDLNFYREI